VKVQNWTVEPTKEEEHVSGMGYVTFQLPCRMCAWESLIVGVTKYGLDIRLFDDDICGNGAILLWKLDEGPSLGTDFL
jgi:hypothetical protein